MACEAPLLGHLLRQGWGWRDPIEVGSQLDGNVARVQRGCHLANGGQEQAEVRGLQVVQEALREPGTLEARSFCWVDETEAVVILDDEARGALLLQIPVGLHPQGQA